MGKIRKWTKDELEILQREYPTKGSNIQKLLNNRTLGVIRAKVSKLKIRNINQNKDDKGRFIKGVGGPKKTQFKNKHLHYPKSKEVLQKESERMKRNNPMHNPIIREKCIRNALLASQKRPTETEKFMLKLIKKYKLPYKYVGNGSCLIGYKNPDFVNVNVEKICIEVFFPYFKIKNYGTVENYKEQRSKHFAKYGWQTLFFERNKIINNSEFVVEQIRGCSK